MLVGSKALPLGCSYLRSVHPTHLLRRKKLTQSLHRICTLSDQLIRMTSVAPPDLCIVHEDDVLIIVDKAANILSVPGKSSKPFTKFRCTQWEDAVREAANSGFSVSESDCQRNLQQLATISSLPRKETKFKDFLRRVLKVDDTELQQSIWKRVCDADNSLNKQSFEEIPNHLVSTADLVEKHCGHKVYIVHRLDMETSGLIMYAKNEASAAELCRQFRTREIQKVYYAKVANKVLAQSQIVSAPLGPDPLHPMIQMVDNVDGKVAVTHVEVIDISEDADVISSPSNMQTSYVKLMPVTGRSHQLRVHMSHIGHPILGDTVYAPHEVVNMYPRLCLHAQTLTFTHPITKTLTTINSKSCVFLPISYICP